jgi:hypothetical protein
MTLQKPEKKKHFENQNYIFKISTKGKGLMMKNNNFPTKRVNIKG